MDTMTLISEALSGMSKQTGFLQGHQRGGDRDSVISRQSAQSKTMVQRPHQNQRDELFQNSVGVPNTIDELISERNKTINQGHKKKMFSLTQNGLDKEDDRAQKRAASSMQSTRNMVLNKRGS